MSFLGAEIAPPQRPDRATAGTPDPDNVFGPASCGDLVGTSPVQQTRKSQRRAASYTEGRKKPSHSEVRLLTREAINVTREAINGFSLPYSPVGQVKKKLLNLPVPVHIRLPK